MGLKFQFCKQEGSGDGLEGAGLALVHLHPHQAARVAVVSEA